MENVFLDRDGVINKVVFRNKKPASPRRIEEFEIKKDFELFYEKIFCKNLNIFVVSNQPDISRNLMLKDDLEQMTIELQRMFNFKQILYCTHDDSDYCSCRKPKPGMVENLIKKYSLHKKESCIIGDSYKDILAGQAAGIATLLLETNYNKDEQCKPNYRIKSLQECISILDF